MSDEGLPDQDRTREVEYVIGDTPVIWPGLETVRLNGDDVECWPCPCIIEHIEIERLGEVAVTALDGWCQTAQHNPRVGIGLPNGLSRLHQQRRVSIRISRPSPRLTEVRVMPDLVIRELLAITCCHSPSPSAIGLWIGRDANPRRRIIEHGHQADVSRHCTGDDRVDRRPVAQAGFGLNDGPRYSLADPVEAAITDRIEGPRQGLGRVGFEGCVNARPIQHLAAVTRRVRHRLRILNGPPTLQESIARLPLRCTKCSKRNEQEAEAEHYPGST